MLRGRPLLSPPLLLLCARAGGALGSVPGWPDLGLGQDSGDAAGVLGKALNLAWSEEETSVRSLGFVQEPRAWRSGAVATSAG